MGKSNKGRTEHRSVTDRGHSRRHETAENHLDAQTHYRNRAKGRKNKAPKDPPGASVLPWGAGNAGRNIDPDALPG